ncbi:MAG: SpoIVB peptidase S55 domain-containing protein [Candidatus Caldatribacteriota bacterium]|nr:SpoIVB peptidase S55 domain-containing protein [Candidatus Caldatribacteriota bacterium]
MKINFDKKINIIVIFISLLILSTGFAYSQAPFMFVSDIKPGMKGIGKTVFHGTKIENFNIEIIDIVSGNNSMGEFILARLNGKQLEESGGISAGMSGSPVYIEGKLIGAISYTWELSDHNLCLITPIKEMLKLLDLPYTYNTLNIPEYGRPTAAPIIVNGLRGRSFDNLSVMMKRFNLRAVQGINNLPRAKIQDVGENPSNRIEPGSAIGIQLTRGDVNISSIGTVTYRQGDRILALGHPFLKRGESAYFLSSVYIYHSLPNMIMPFKIGAPLHLIGCVSQDREAGIVGVLNTYPRIIPLKINVENIDSGLTYQMGVQLVEDDLLLEPFVSNITVQAIDNALDSIKEGSARVEIKVTGMNEDHEIYRKNMYCSSDDIAVQTIKEIPEIIEIITSNYFEKVNLTEININIKISNTIKCGRIEEVKLDTKIIKPGDSLKAEVKIRAFRKGLIVKNITLKIPSSLPESEAVLIVKGGGISDLFSEEENYYLDQENYKSLKEAIENISERPGNNQIVGEIVIYNNEILSDEEVSPNHYKEKEKKDSLISIIDTDMVIEGYMEIPFTISR